MKSIKNAQVYKATIPVDHAILAGHLAERPFMEPQPKEDMAYGFVPPRTDKEDLLAAFDGGFGFSVRIDTKILPASVLAAEVKRITGAFDTQHGRKPKKVEREDIKTVAKENLLVKAFARTAVIPAFYHVATGFLIVATTSKHLAGVVTTALIHAVGSVKTETIHVSDVKGGLTTRLGHWLAGESEAFGKFEPLGDATLKLEKQRLGIKVLNLGATHDALKEAIRRGFSVTGLSLETPAKYGAMSFKLTDDFAMRGIAFAEEVSIDDIEDAWALQASYQVADIAQVVTLLCEMFAYKEKGAAEEQEDSEVTA